LVSETLGFLIGTLRKNTYVYLLAAPFSIIFSHLNEYFLFLFFKEDKLIAISNLLSLQEPLIHGVDIDYSGARVDLLFAMKCVFTLIFTLLIVVVTIIVAQKRFAFNTVIALCSCLIVLPVLGRLYVSIFPKVYSYEDKLYITDDRSAGYMILSYEGDIRLSEYSDFKCIVTVKKGIGDLTLRLDETLKIHELTLEGRKIKYIRSGDFIVIPENEIPNMNSFSVGLLYGGRVQYRSDVDSINIYTSWFSSALPPNFAFIPIVDGDLSEKDYNFSVKCANALISNLTVEAGDVYTVSGRSNTFCLFCGFLTQFEKEGIIFYRAKYNKATDYWVEYQSALTRYSFDPYTCEFENLSTKPRKVFMIYYLYGIFGYPVVFDDYIMLNYGYPS